MSAMSRTQLTNCLPGRNESRLEAAPRKTSWRRTTHLERQVVVLVLQCSGEILEVLAAGRRLRLLRGGSAAGSLSHAFPISIGRPSASARRTEHDELTHVDLRGVARLAVLVL